jgi:hypothetical protein
MDAITRGVTSRPPEADLTYRAFVDMSGGSNDDATLATAISMRTTVPWSIAWSIKARSRLAARGVHQPAPRTAHPVRGAVQLLM